MKITGECFCGEMTYTLSDSIQNPTMCHCSQCRKAFGGTGSVFSLISPSSFTWTNGEGNLQTYVSKKGWGVGFCKKCGTTLCGIYQGNVVGIDVGALNNNPPLAVKEHIYVDSKACWDNIGDNSPQYKEASTKN